MEIVLVSKYNGWRGLACEEEGRDHSIWWRYLRSVCEANRNVKWFENTWSGGWEKEKNSNFG